MRFARLLIYLLVSACIGHASAQSRFDRMQAEVLEKSANQWLCMELKAVNPEYFNCSKQGWLLPGPGKYALCDDTLVLTEEHTERFRNIWFPNGDCRRFLSVVAMADVYMPLFKRKVEQLSLHSDVAYMPVVLSGCNQHFQSGDAAGLWAMPFLAARKQHLRVDTLVDERLGGDFTTDAAVKHFAYVLQVQREDYWRALVAYSFGASEVAALDSSIRGLSFMDAIRLEASDYLRFQAYTIRLLQGVHVDNQLTNCFDILGHFQPVIIDNPMQVEAIASVLKVDENRLRNSNPVYIGHVLVPGYRKVPFVLEDTLVGRFQLMKDSIARWRPVQIIKETEVWETTWVQHRVGKGESLGRIAAKYHVTVAQLKKWNKLRGDKIRNGQVLKIEQRRRVVRKEIENQNENEKVNEKEATVKAVENPVPGPQSPTANSNSSAGQPSSTASRPSPSKYYTVKRGDSLWSIAKKYPGVTEQDLMKWNKCGENIRPGQRLVIRD
jgi:membrane-bound lytic murein transglycosylase D